MPVACFAFQRKLLFLLLFFCFSAACASRESESKDHVLILNSVIRIQYAENRFLKTLRKTLSSKENVSVSVEQLELQGSGDNRKSAAFSSLLSNKYADNPPTLILTTDTYSFMFMQKVRNTFFPKASWIFCGIPKYNFSGSNKPLPNSGIYEKLPIKSLLRLIGDVYPECENLLVVHDDYVGLAYLEDFYTNLSGIAHSFRIKFATETSFTQLRSILSELPDNTAVIALPFQRDTNGEWCEQSEIAALYRDTSVRPVFSFSEQLVRKGCTGGAVLGNVPYGV